MRKQILAVLLVLAMLVAVLAGCSGNASSSSETGSESSSSAVESSDASEPESAESVGAGEGPTVTIWECQWGNESYEQVLQKLAEQATEANIDGRGIKVEVSMVSWDNYYDTFLTAVTSGTAPDIACEASTGPIMYADMGESLDLMPIYDAWVAEESTMLDEIPQEAFDYFTYEGELTGMPFAIDSTAMIYNKALFEEAGIKEIPTTWDELYDVCKTLKEVFPDKIPIAFSAATPANVTSLLDWVLHSNGSSILTEDFKPNLQSDNSIHVLEIFKKFYDEGLFGAGASSYTTSDLQRLYMAEEAVMVRSQAPTYLADTDLHDKTGIIVPVAGPDVEAGKATASYQAFHAFKQTEDAEATLGTLKWWIENNLISWTEGGNMTIPVRSTYREEACGADALVQEYLDVNVGQSEPYIYPQTGLYPFHTVLDSEATAAVCLQEILTGTDVQTAAQKCNDAIADVMADAGY